MHRELGAAHEASGDPVVVAGADHEGLLTEARYALQAARAIAEFAGYRGGAAMEREAHA